MLGAIAGAVGGVTSTILGNKANKAEAQRNRDFQEEMSNTSVQRRVADMKAAGLNPLLAVSNASSGAITPSGSQATYDFNGATQGVSNALNFMLQKKATEANIAKTNMETKKVADDMITSEVNRLNTQLDTKLKEVGIDSEYIKQDLLSAQTDKERAEVLKKYKETDKLSADIKKSLVDTSNAVFDLETKMKNPELSEAGMQDTFRRKRDKQNLDIDKQKLENKQKGQDVKAWKNTTWGQNVGSIFNGFSKVLGAGASAYKNFK